MLFNARHVEIQALFNQFIDKQQYSIAVTAAFAEEGVTSVVLALAESALLSGKSVLIVDLNTYRPAFQATMPLANQPVGSLTNLVPQIVSPQNSQLALTGVVAPQDHITVLTLRKPNVLKQYLAEVSQHYDLVIVDTPPLSQVNQHNIPAEKVAAACDATIMVTLSGRTSVNQVMLAVEKLKQAKANLVGSVLNDHYTPSLKNEMIREIARLPGLFSRLKKHWIMRLKNNKFLSMSM